MQQSRPDSRRDSHTALFLLGRTGRPRALVAAIAGLCLCATGCKLMSYPEETPTQSETVLPADPHVATSIEPGAWVELSAAGRYALRVRDYEAAEENYVAALAETATLPDYDARVRTALGNVVRIAALYQTQERWNDSGGIVSLLIENAKQGRRADFYNAAPVLVAQGRFHQSQGRVREAIEIYESSLLMRDADSPREAPQRLHVEHLIARAYMSVGQPEKAVALLERVRKQTIRVRGPASKDAAKAHYELAVAQDRSGQFAAAEAAYLSAIEIQDALQPDGLDVALVRNELALSYLSRDRNQHALEHAQKAVANLEIHDVKGAALASVLDTLAQAEARLGRAASAELHWKRALEALDETEPETQRRLQSVRQNYAALLRSLNRPEEAYRIEMRIGSTAAQK